jgi:hypothetical protein
MEAGPVSVRGVAQVRSTLSGLEEPSLDRVSANSKSKGGWLEDLIRLDSAESHSHDIGKKDAAQSTGTIASGAAAHTSKVETKFAKAQPKKIDTDTTIAMQPQDRTSASNEGVAIKENAPITQGKPAKSQSKRSRKSSRQRRSRTAETAGSKKKTVHRSDQITRPGMVKKAPTPLDGYVTLIIEIAVDASPRPRRSGRGQSSSKPKGEDPNAR